MNELALFAGAGGGILGGHILGWRTVCAVEYEPYAAAVLAQRQNDGLLAPFPIWDDVRTFDGRAWRGRVDVVSGGFPCQDISAAGKGAGITGERSGLWVEMARIIGEIRPRYAFVENSPMLTVRGLGVVLGDLAALGFDARWGVLGAADVGAPHLRQRIWIVAEQRGFPSHADRSILRELPGRQRGPGGTTEPTESADDGEDRALADAGSGRCSRADGGEVEQPQGAETIGSGEDVAHSNMRGQQGFWLGGILDAERKALGDDADGRSSALANSASANDQTGHDQIRFGKGTQKQFRGGGCHTNVCDATCQRLEERENERGDPRHEFASIERADWWQSEPDVGRVAHGVAAQMDRLKAIGNGQVPQCAAEAFRLLSGRIVMNDR